jgi:hypothetical protein
MRMFANIKRKKLKIKKDDYKNTSLMSSLYLGKMPKDERRFMALARPDLVVIVQRYTLICEMIRPATAEHKQRAHYLASIAENDVKNIFSREQFWRKIDIELKRLKVAPEVERTARAKINNRIPRPTEAAFTNAFNKLKQAYIRNEI